MSVRPSPPLGHPARPETHPARLEAQSARPEAQPARSEAQTASQPSLRLQASGIAGCRLVSKLKNSFLSYSNEF